MQAVAAPGQVKFEIDIFARTGFIGLGADLFVAAFETTVERADFLPFETIGGKAVGVPLAQKVRADAVAVAEFIHFRPILALPTLPVSEALIA